MNCARIIQLSKCLHLPELILFVYLGHTSLKLNSFTIYLQQRVTHIKSPYVHRCSTALFCSFSIGRINNKTAYTQCYRCRKKIKLEYYKHETSGAELNFIFFVFLVHFQYLCANNYNCCRKRCCRLQWRWWSCGDGGLISSIRSCCRQIQ